MLELQLDKAAEKIVFTSSLEIDDRIKKYKFQLILKRVFDICFSLAGLIFLLPVFLIISILIKVNSKGPVLFKQIRVGKNGKLFYIFKFRTMVINAEQKGMQITVGKDPRITKIGNFLRKYKIDELPQLINVLIGDMSFVGPRPEVLKYVELYDEVEKNVLKVRPGITDYASIEYFDESLILAESDEPEKTYIEEIMKRKLKLNMVYLKNISLWIDVKLILKTIQKIIV
jgi:lipopolysaccharide/colanic/teichoic acid biosynthesis glycosyltransferase